MRNSALAQRPALMAALLAGGALVALVLLQGTDSPLSRLTRLDVSFLALPLALCGVLLAFGRLALWLRGTALSERVTWRVRTGREATRVLPLATVLPVAHRLLTDLGWAALGLGLLSSVPALPGVVSGHPWAPDIANLGRYLGGFDSLAIWGIFLLAPFLAARAVAEARPNVGAIFDVPWTRLAAFGGAYALLANDGALFTAFSLDGAWVLLGLGLALGISCVALVMRRAMAFSSPEHQSRLRKALYLAEAALVVALLGAMAALQSAAGNASAGPDAVSPGSLDVTYLALLFPFALIYYAGVLRPAVAMIGGSPIGHLVSLALVYVVFSGDGVLSTAFAVDISGMLTALTVAVALSYAAMVLRNVAKIEAPGRNTLLTTNVSRSLSVLASAAALALVVGVGLAHLPVANAVLLDRPGTRELGEALLPFLGGFHEARNSIAWLSFTATAMLLLPRVLGGHTFLRYQPMLSSVSYFALGCLTWLTASGLSTFGHGFTFGGAIAATGMFSLALTRLARYATDSSNLAVADIAGWLSASQVRGFILGASVAFYVLLLRPVVYEMLWFAALYEYIALLVLLLPVLLNVVNRLRLVANAPENTQPAWTDWSHHRQVLESKADPRSELTDALRQRFVDHGDWKQLLAYLLGLLYRSETSLDTMLAVCRSLRHAAVKTPPWNILRRSDARLKRTVALEYSLDIVDGALASSSPQLERVHEDDIRKAAASFIDRETDPEALAVTLIVAHCQRGDDLEVTVDRWFSLVAASARVPGWFTRPWGRSNARLRGTLHRLDLVNGAIASLYGDATPSEPASPPSLTRVTRGHP